MPNIQTEVVDKLRLPTADHLKPGDILFRWVPRGIGQRGAIQNLITAAQSKQMSTQYLRHRDDSAVQQSALVVQHVGIYTERGVREIGSGGLKYVAVQNRCNYDLVVRSRAFADEIARVAQLAMPDRRQFLYPVWDLDIIARQPTYGYDACPVTQLHQAELALHRGRSNPAKLKQAVVCSHYVHAVLYAASVPGATLRTATDHRWDRYFKISPSHMWTEFVSRKGLWAQLDAFYVGMQHQGMLSRNIDPRVLGVGLNMPPVPTRIGRPAVTALNA